MFMVSKKDILDVALWSSISAVMGVSIASITPVFTEDYSRAALMKACVEVFMGSETGGIIGGRHIASMKDRYNTQEIEPLILATVASTSAICGILGGYVALPTTYGQDSISYGAINKDSLEPGMEFAVEWCGMSMFFGTISFILALGATSQGLEMMPLRFPTREEKANLKLKEVLSYDERRDKDIFKTLERYNKVYTKMFTRLGTPYEMAKFTNNEEAAKKIVDKNEQLILTALLANRHARDNVKMEL